jgi:urease gamma subunit
LSLSSTSKQKQFLLLCKTVSRWIIGCVKFADRRKSMTNTIPHELAAALLSDMEQQKRMEQMHLFQQEALAYISCHLHRTGLMDARVMANVLLEGSRNLVEALPTYGYSLTLAETFAGRVEDILESDSLIAGASPPQCE